VRILTEVQNSLTNHTVILRCSGCGSLKLKKVDIVFVSLILVALGVQQWQLFLNWCHDKKLVTACLNIPCGVCLSISVHCKGTCTNSCRDAED